MSCNNWANDNLVYVPQMDNDHQVVMEDLERVRRSLGSSNLRNEIWRLSQAFSVHLTSEERLMTRSHYAGREWHRGQHSAGRAKMRRLMEAGRSDTPGRVADLLDDFGRWLESHVTLADRMLAAHLRNSQRQSSVS